MIWDWKLTQNALFDIFSSEWSATEQIFRAPVLVWSMSQTLNCCSSFRLWWNHHTNAHSWLEEKKPNLVADFNRALMCFPAMKVSYGLKNKKHSKFGHPSPWRTLRFCNSESFHSMQVTFKMASLNMLNFLQKRDQLILRGVDMNNPNSHILNSIFSAAIWTFFSFIWTIFNKTKWFTK